MKTGELKTVFSPQNINAILTEPTPRLRWFGFGSYKTLQQWWATTTYDNNGYAVGLGGEWRDVPTESE
jgi:hypothetical protein